MQILAFGIHLLFLAVTFSIYRKISNPFVLFNFIWSVLLGIAIIGAPGIMKPSDAVFGYFLFGGTAFNIFGFLFMLLDNVLHFSFVPKKKHTLIPNHIKQAAVTVLQLVIFAYYIYKALAVLNNLRAGASYEFIRGYYYSDDFFTSTLEYLIVTYLFDPMITLTGIVFAFNLFHRDYNRLTLTVMCANIILRAVISGGRMILFEFGVFIILLFFNQYKLLKSNRKVKRRIFAFFGLAMIVGIFINTGRTAVESGNHVGSALETLITNFTGSFSYFSILDRNGTYVPRSYGGAIFAGIRDIFVMMTNMLGITSISLIRNDIGIMLSRFYLIGNYSYNAMPTMYYYFLTDFGKLGLLIGPLLLSLYCTWAYQQSRRFGTYKTLALYLLMMLVVVESSMMWVPFNSSFIMAIFYTMFFMSNKTMGSNSCTEAKK